MEDDGKTHEWMSKECGWMGSWIADICIVKGGS